MHLSLCMITKGDSELTSLQNAVGSIIDYVDEVHITTNSEEIEKTKSWCEKNPKINHTHLDWSDDFATQRNFNFSQASEKTDYILWIDSDDVIVNGHLLRDVAKISKGNGYDTVFFAYWYGAKFNGVPSVDTFIETEITHYRERLIKPGSIVWKKRIHETPVPVAPDAFKYSTVKYSEESPIAWLHLGADRDIDPVLLDARMQRNQRLLEMELEDERREGEADPRTILYLMKIYAESNDADTLTLCIEMGREYLTKSGWDEERALCYQLMSRCMGTLGENEKAKKLLHSAIEEYPFGPMLYLHLARVYFNLKNYRAMKHWMDLGMNIEIKDTDSSINNLLELKVLSSELLLNYHLYVEKNMQKAYKSARTLFSVNPTEQNRTNVELLFDQSELDKASAHAHGFMKYLEDIQHEGLVLKFLNSMPKVMQELPFAIYYKTKYTPARVWGKDEICYYASFGQPHFEKWDGNSLQKGIGGSETAVIRLSEEWTKLGYKVTVYCDPVKEIEVNGVLYKPYNTFNPKDKFYTFIQWRGSHLAKRISAKRFMVDLHDVYHESSHLDKLDQIDKLMVKSEFHSDYAPSVASSKKKVISNGI